MRSESTSIWGHPFSDQGGEIDRLLLQKTTVAQIIQGFSERYPAHENPKRRVTGHLKHLETVHKVDLSFYLK